MKLEEKIALKSLLLPSVSLLHIRLHRVHPMSHEICCTCLPKWWLLVSIQTFDVELSFYLGLDPKELAFKHTSVVDWYTCPSKVGAFKQYIKLFCWCSRFLQLSLQLCVVRTSTHPISARKSGVHQLISVQARRPTKCQTARWFRLLLAR